MITKYREHNYVTKYTRIFRGAPGCWWAFPCDKDGNCKTSTPEGAEDLRKCLDGTYTIREVYTETETRSWSTPAEGVCDRCGAEMVFSRFTNTCECGADHDMSGHLLAPREFWGEETGESVADILAADLDCEREEDFCE